MRPEGTSMCLSRDVRVADLSYRPKIIGRCEKSHVVAEGNGLKVRNQRGT